MTPTEPGAREGGIEWSAEVDGPIQGLMAASAFVANDILTLRLGTPGRPLVLLRAPLHLAPSEPVLQGSSSPASRPPGSPTPSEPDIATVLQAVWDMGDELDSNHTRFTAGRVADRFGVTIRAHNDFSEPPRNRNEERIAELEAALRAASSPALDDREATNRLNRARAAFDVIDNDCGWPEMHGKEFADALGDLRAALTDRPAEKGESDGQPR